MRWLDIDPVVELGSEGMVGLARQLVAKRPDNMAARLSLARGLYDLGEYQDALVHFERVVVADPAVFGDWQRLSRCYTRSGRPAEGLTATRSGLAALGDTATIRLREGEALEALGEADAAKIAFERCVALGDDRDLGLTALIRPLAQQSGGAALLAYCDALPPALADSALALAGRAIAYSRLGRASEAGTLIDLDRDVVQTPIRVPDGFADVAAFNAALTHEVLTVRDARGDTPDREIAYCPDLSRRPVLAALLPSIREAVEDYLRRAETLGRTMAVPPVPPTAKLFYGMTVLRGDGSNGEHMHSHGRISTVYHVLAPDSVREATDDRGALIVGPCDHFSNGHIGCWGRKIVRPLTGMVTIFPSHFFHDVVPSRTAEPRISIPADLVPVWT